MTSGRTQKPLDNSINTLENPKRPMLSPIGHNEDASTGKRNRCSIMVMRTLKVGLCTSKVEVCLHVLEGRLGPEVFGLDDGWGRGSLFYLYQVLSKWILHVQMRIPRVE